MNRNRFYAYFDFDVAAQLLSDAERGQLWNAVFEFARSGQEIELPPMVRMAFAGMKSLLVRDLGNYAGTCQRNKMNGIKGGRPKSINHAETQSVINKPSRFIDNPVGLQVTKNNRPAPSIYDQSRLDMKDYNRGVGEKPGSCDVDSQFEEFWAKYPPRNGRKIGKKICHQAFMKLRADDRSAVIAATVNYAESRQLPKDPERFLKADYWREWLPGIDGEKPLPGPHDPPESVKSARINPPPLYTDEEMERMYPTVNRIGLRSTGTDNK